MRQARYLAESAIHRAIYTLCNDAEFGTHDLPSETVLVPVTEPDVAKGVLTFNSATAANEGIPWSSNRITSQEGGTGWSGRAVPPGCARLFGVGTYHGKQARVEAIVHMPQWPFVIGVNGRFRSNGGLLVASAPEDTESYGSVSTDDDEVDVLDLDNLGPGHLVSNADVKLGAGTIVTGNVQAVGGIDLGTSTVKGDVSTFADPSKIPDVDLSQFDPAGDSHLQHVAGHLHDADLTGFSRREGSLLVDGNLHLDGALLYVDGDVTVKKGCVTGQGALVATGNVLVDGDVALDADNIAALLAGGNVTLIGSNPDTSSFQGMVYSKGKFTATGLTLAGIFVAGEADVSGGRMITIPSMSTFQIGRYHGQRKKGIQDTRGEGRHKRDNDVRLRVDIDMEGDDLAPFYGPDGKLDRDKMNLQTVRYRIKVTVGRHQTRVFHRVDRAEDYITNVATIGGDYSVREMLKKQVRAAIRRMVKRMPKELEHQPPRIITFDLNQLLSPQERVRVLLWRDLTPD